MDDPSEHLAINESTGEYYCYRNPKHSGHSLPALFWKLKLPKETYANLKGDYTAGFRHSKDENDYTLWRHFGSAANSEECLGYLRNRMFLDPQGAATKFNLKFATDGEWAGRLLIPMTIGWTGRAMRPHLEDEIRYKAYTSEDGFYYFGQRSSTAIIVEGALDAMRIASVSNQFDVYAKCRIVMSSAMINQLRDKNYHSIYSSPDSTVTYLQSREELQLIRSYCTRSFIGQIKTYMKDFGAMSESETRSLLRKVGYDSNLGVLRQPV